MKRLCSGTKMTSWVDPAFTDLPSDRLRDQKRPRAVCSRAESRKPIQTRTDPGPGLDQPWVDRHSPQSQAELVVHKKKVEEVEKWMMQKLNSSKGGVLLLSGPSGCGKTATVKVLCKELGARLQEWNNPVEQVRQEGALFTAHQQERALNGLIPVSVSQLQQFQDFLLRANKYKCLQMNGDSTTSSQKVILVEDFPNQFYRQPSSLHDLLRRFVRTSRCPLIFIMSDSVSSESSSRILFPRDVQEELGITNISFNPVPPTALMKLLSRVVDQEVDRSGGRLAAPERPLLDRLCSGSAGDIRSAINSLQFTLVSDVSLERNLLNTLKPSQTAARKGRTKAKRVKSKPSKAVGDEEEQAIGGKDASLFLFRALGKILHCKRLEAAAATEGLPAHLSEHHREPLLVDPESVVERAHMSAELFNLYLHQNYLDFFCEVEDVDRASQYLSDADLLSAEWSTRSLMCTYSSSVATRGLLHSNSQQVTVGFKPLHKPHWLHVHKKYRGNCLAAQSLFRNFCLTPVELQTELLPYLAKLSNPMRNQAQIDMIQDVGQLCLRRRPDRLKLETVVDKEWGEEEEEEEEDHGSEEGLSSSQPQPSSTQALLQSEELLIEEFDSD